MIKTLKNMLIVSVVLAFFQFYGCSGNVQMTETVKAESPVAVAKADPHFGTAPISVKFDGTDSHAEGEGELSYLWDFDDGTKGDGATTEHEFKAVGTYMVTLTVKDSSGRDDTSWVTIIVN